LIMILFTLALIWSIFGEVDIVAVAHGKIIPSGHSKIIQSVETSVVKAIHVKDGQKVNAGDLLIELDTTITKADFDNASQQNQSLDSDQQRTQYLINLLDAQLNKQNNILRTAKAELDPLQYQILDNSWHEYQQQHNVLQSAYQQKQSELAATNATVSKLQQVLPLTEKRMNAFDIWSSSKNILSKRKILKPSAASSNASPRKSARPNHKSSNTNTSTNARSRNHSLKSPPK
jgi:hemolysin D